MDHGGDMDMGDGQCSMNVSMSIQNGCLPTAWLTKIDAFHLVFQEPVYYLSAVACHWDSLAPHFTRCNRPPDRRLRMGSRHEQTL